jgi:hypothetical protein
VPHSSPSQVVFQGALLLLLPCSDAAADIAKLLMYACMAK